MADTQARIRRAFGTRPFRAGEAREAGITRSALAWAVEQGWVHRLGHGVYRTAGEGGYLDLVRTALARHPDAVASHDSAAAMHGIACPWPGGWKDVHLISPGRGRRFALAHVHDLGVSAADTVLVDDLRCTGPERTVLDLAALLPLPASLVVADSYARQGRPSRVKSLNPAFRAEIRERLLAATARLQGRRGIEQARRVCALVDPAAESPAESWARGLVIEGRFPPPAVGVPVIGASGRTYYADLCWEDARLIVEVDGVGKYASRDHLVREKQREDDLRAAGWEFARWLAGDLWRTPELVPRSLLRHGLGQRTAFTPLRDAPRHPASPPRGATHQGPPRAFPPQHARPHDTPPHEGGS